MRTRFAFLGGEAQDDLGSANVGFDGAHRAFDHQTHTDCGGQMVNEIGKIDELCHQPGVGDRVNAVLEPGVILKALDVGHRAGGKIVNNVDFVAGGKVSFGKVRTDEPRSSGDEDLHSRLPAMKNSVLDLFEEDWHKLAVRSIHARQDCSV